MVKVHLPIATDSPMLRRNMSHFAWLVACPLESRPIGEIIEMK